MNVSLKADNYAHSKSGKRRSKMTKKNRVVGMKKMSRKSNKKKSKHREDVEPKKMKKVPKRSPKKDDSSDTNATIKENISGYSNLEDKISKQTSPESLADKNVLPDKKTSDDLKPLVTTDDITSWSPTLEMEICSFDDTTCEDESKSIAQDPNQFCLSYSSHNDIAKHFAEETKEPDILAEVTCSPPLSSEVNSNHLTPSEVNIQNLIIHNHHEGFSIEDHLNKRPDPAANIIDTSKIDCIPVETDQWGNNCSSLSTRLASLHLSPLFAGSTPHKQMGCPEQFAGCHFAPSTMSVSYCDSIRLEMEESKRAEGLRKSTEWKSKRGVFE